MAANNRTIDEDVALIRTAIYGREVREAIASSMEDTYDACEAFKTAAAGSATAAAGSAADAAATAAAVALEVSTLESNVDDLATDAAVVNLLPPVYASENSYGRVYVTNGLTWTVNTDGTVTVTGTATAATGYHLCGTSRGQSVPVIELDPQKTYIVSGCPEGGSSSSYGVRVRWTDSADEPTSSSGTVKSDYGSGTHTGEVAGLQPGFANVYCWVASGYTCPDEGITFRPMLEIGDTAHGYVSTHTGVSALTRRLESEAYGNHKTMGMGLKVYVDAVNGDDTNAGTSAAAAVKTMARVLEIVNRGAYTQYSVYLMGNNVYEYTPTVSNGACPHFFTLDGAATLRFTGNNPRFYSTHVNLTGSAQYPLTVESSYGSLYFEGGQIYGYYVIWKIPVRVIGGGCHFDCCTFTTTEGVEYPATVTVRAGLFVSQCSVRLHGYTTFDITDGSSYGLYISQTSYARLYGTMFLRDQAEGVARTDRKPFLYSDSSSILWNVTNTLDTHSTPMFYGLEPYGNAIHAVQSYISVDTPGAFETLQRYGIRNDYSSIGYGEEWRNDLQEKAPIDSPEFTGIPTAPTPGGDGNSRIATTDFVTAQLAAAEGGLENLIGATHITMGTRRTLYVDGVNGDDTRTGASKAQALKTLAKAVEIVNLGQQASYNLHLAAGAEYALDASVTVTPSLNLYPDSTYTKVTPEAGDNPMEMGWYERSSEDGSYALSNDEEQTEFTDYYMINAAPVLRLTGQLNPRIYSANINLMGSADCRLTVTSDYGLVGFYGGQGRFAHCDFAVPVRAVGGAYRFESCSFTVEAGKTYPAEVEVRAALYVSQSSLRVHGDTTFDVTDSLSYGLYIANSSTAKLHGTWHLKDQDSSIAQESRKPFLLCDFSTVFWYVANTPDTSADPLFLGLVPYGNALEAVQSYITIGSKVGLDTLIRYGVVNTRSSIGFGAEWRAGEDTTAVDTMVQIAESYRAQNNTPNQLVYNQSRYTALRNYDGGRDIDCSTFIGLILMGLSYEDSPYNGVPIHVGPYEWAVDLKTNQIDVVSRICRMMTYAGCRLKWELEEYDAAKDKTAEEIVEKLKAAGVRKGDILFTAGSLRTDSYLGMTHMLLVRTNNLDAEYPFIDSDGGTYGVWREKAIKAQCIKAICRPITTSDAPGRYADAIDTLEDYLRPKAQGRNLVPWPYASDGATVAGITYTVGDDGSIHAVGTATAQSVFTYAEGVPLMRDTFYMLSGCPREGGGDKTFWQRMRVFVDGTRIINEPDFGNGGRFNTGDLEPGVITADLDVVIYAGQTVDLTVWPMLEIGDYTSLFESPAESNVTLRKEIDELKAAVAALGGAV